MSETRATLSVAIITFNEEANIARTLESVKAIADEIIVVDSHSTDRTVAIAKEFGAKVYVEDWKGFAAQKNSALDKCTCEWILSLDADEEVSGELRHQLRPLITSLSDSTIGKGSGYRNQRVDVPFWGIGPLERPLGFFLARRNLFLGKWLRHGGFYPDRKLRLVRRGFGAFQNRKVHEDIRLNERASEWFHAWDLRHAGDLIHHQYPTLTSYIEHMNRYSSLGAEMVVEKRGRVSFSLINIVVRPIATFIYNYVFRFGFLDGKEGLLLHLYHSVYVSWKYAKAWEMSRLRSAITGKNE